MQLPLILAVSVTSSIWLLIVFYSYYRHKKALSALSSDYSSRLESFINTKQKELKESYDKGVLDAELKKDLSVVVRPWREESENSSFWKNKKTLKVGYIHQLYSNGIPCLEPHITVHEEISTEKLNQDNIDNALHKVDLLLSNLPFAKHPAVHILSSAASPLFKKKKK